MEASSEAKESQQPFAGIRVVEFGQFVAVPFAAQLLAEGGAQVIKIEALEGDPTRRLAPIAPGETRTFISRNRGKHSLPLALRDPKAKPVIDALLRHADVALMNFRPGLAEKIGLGESSLRERFPRLIIGTVTAFGKEGPDAGFAGMDIVVQARTGLMAANGRIVDDRPAPGDPVSADYMCAMSLAFGVSAALLRRERTGQGGAVDTSLMQAAMTLANNQLIRSEERDGPQHREILTRLAEQRKAGATYAEQLEGMPSNRAMPMLKVYFRTYDTADAVIAIACGSHSLRLKFMAAIGMEDPGLTMDEASNLRGTHYDELASQTEALLRSQSSDTWIDLLREAGVPVSSVKFPVELFDDPQARANGMFHLLHHPSAGDLTVLSPPVRLNEGGFIAAPATAALGSETESILADLGFSGSDVDALVAAGVTLKI
ncbi:MAG: CoA transferase [Proteobacteria bacterium]|nr:CoA transferase [Pseudomonadota bacterium]